MNYFKNLIDLLLLEQEEDKNSFLELTKHVSVQDRRANGVTWYPIAIRDSEIGKGDYLTVEVERTTHQDIDHQFRFGATVSLFSNLNPNEDFIEGTITHCGTDRMRISFRKEELPEWSSKGKLGVNLLFDDNSYKEMFSALSRASVLIEEDPLVAVLLGEKKTEFDQNILPYRDNSLNDKQLEAVNQILEAKYLAIVHGPPGTGKTTTLVKAILSIYEREQEQVLVCAPSNTAVDLLSERLAAAGLKVLRIGNPARVSETLSHLTLDAQMQEHKSMKQIKELKKRAAAFRKMAYQYKRSFGRAERDQRKALIQEVRDIMKSVEETEKYILSDLLTKTQVITTTLVGAAHYTLREVKFHTVVIDEAVQALEPATWIPVLKAQKVVFAGDHCQLPPTVKSFEAGKKGLTNTLFEKLVVLHPEAVVMLEEQYRMHHAIMSFPSAIFYKNELKAAPEVAERLLFPGDELVIFIDTAGCGFEEKQDGMSVKNPEEAVFLIKYLREFITRNKRIFNQPPLPAIAVISPYKKQVMTLENLINDDLEFAGLKKQLTVNTVDGFQGREKDVVCISLVRSNTKGEIGFLNDIRRMNVAITRAKKKLILIGDSATLSNHSFYNDWIEFTQREGFYHSAWEFMND